MFTVPTATVSRPPAPVTITRTIRPANKAPTVQQEPTTETLESDNYTDDDTLKKANEIGPYTTDVKLHCKTA